MPALLRALLPSASSLCYRSAARTCCLLPVKLPTAILIDKQACCSNLLDLPFIFLQRPRRVQHRGRLLCQGDWAEGGEQRFCLVGLSGMECTGVQILLQPMRAAATPRPLG